MRSTDVITPPQQIALRWPTAPSAIADHFQLIALRLDAALAGKASRVVAIASPQAADGRTTTTIHVARALSQGLGKRVLVVDGDLARPGLTAALNLMPGALGSAAPGGPYALAAGGDTIVELVQQLADLRSSYDYVLVDTPPIDRSADAAIVGRACDGVLLLVRSGRTLRDKLDAALDALVDAPLVGCVLVDQS